VGAKGELCAGERERQSKQTCGDWKSCHGRVSLSDGDNGRGSDFVARAGRSLPPTRKSASTCAPWRFGGLKPVRSSRSERRRVGGQVARRQRFCCSRRTLASAYAQERFHLRARALRWTQTRSKLTE